MRTLGQPWRSPSDDEDIDDLDGLDDGEGGDERLLGVCSWSLEPKSPQDLAAKVQQCGVRAVQLALDPIRTGAWTLSDTMQAFENAGLGVVSGMMGCKGENYSTLQTIRETGGIRPEATWAENLKAAEANAQIADDLELSLVTLHAGFLPAEPKSAERHRMLERLRRLGDVFGEHDIMVGLETGQESAQTLLGVLEELEHPMIGVNFDPANMILYGMGDPVAALQALSAFVLQVHIKDAVATKTPGMWGSEVAAGSGAVNWSAFFDVIKRDDLPVDCIIEREAGTHRVADINTARALCERYMS